MIRSVFDTLGGLWQLLRLGLMTGFRFKGPYWKWRVQTAFGRGLPPTLRQRLHAVLDHARWIHRMRRNMH